MTDHRVRILSAKAFRKYRDTHSEGQYALVDVRQPAEYTCGHIPGAKLIPLPELESRLSELPVDREWVFYCRSGARSMAAATLAMENAVTGKSIYNLTGGIMAWQDRVLTDFPKIETFAADAPLPALLYTAMDLEKGAWRFYEHLRVAHAGEPFADIFTDLSKAETGHAHMVYRFWEKTQTSPPPFDTLYFTLPGEILEGGERLRDLLSRLDEASARESSQDPPCIHLLEIAMMIELAAFDLYRTLADVASQPETCEIFLAIAQAEKSHIQQLIRALEACPSR